jgi:hypothetical protein
MSRALFAVPLLLEGPVLVVRTGSLELESYAPTGSLECRHPWPRVGLLSNLHLSVVLLR